MRIIFMSFLLGFFSTAYADEKCPSIQGDYIAQKCPVDSKAYAALRVFQTDCRAVGFQSLVIQPDSSVSGYGDVRWEVVGAGKLLQKEDKFSAIYKEKFFDQDSLYTYSYSLDKLTNLTTITKVEMIDILKEGNLLIWQDSTGPMASIWFNLKSCK